MLNPKGTFNLSREVQLMPSKDLEHRREVQRRWARTERGREKIRAGYMKESALKYRRDWRRKRYWGSPEVRALYSAKNKAWRIANKALVQELDRRKKLRVNF